MFVLKDYGEAAVYGGLNILLASLASLAPGHIPQLNDEGEALRRIGHMLGQQVLGKGKLRILNLKGNHIGLVDILPVIAQSKGYIRLVFGAPVLLGLGRLRAVGMGIRPIQHRPVGFRGGRLERDYRTGIAAENTSVNPVIIGQRPSGGVDFVGRADRQLLGGAVRIDAG